MTRKEKYAAFFALVLALVVIGLNISRNYLTDAKDPSDTNVRTVQLKGKIINAMVADTPELRARGLSGRDGLAQDEGMLFIFDSDGKYQFWMKDMRFPIDILWISNEGKVVDIKESVSPSTYPAVFAPNSPARYVLELPAGFTKENDVPLGGIVQL